jgi:ABC-type uncharacterized transport system substrate-binding protein
LLDHHQRVPCALHNRCGRQYHRVKVTASDGAGGNGWFQEKPSVALLFDRRLPQQNLPEADITGRRRVRTHGWLHRELSPIPAGTWRAIISTKINPKGIGMRRREFITLLGGAAATWPLAARAQPTERTRRIGVLIPYSESDPEGRIRVKELEQTLQKLGWTEGRNLQVDYRWAGGEGDRFRAHAAELVRLGEDAIVAISSPAVKALQRETRTIPIVFTQVSDPVGQGIVENMARPGGIVTGFTNYDPAISGKWLELLKEAAPSIRRAAIIFNPKTAPYTTLYVRAIEAIAPSIAVKVTTAPVHDDAEIEVAFTRHAREQGGGLIVMTDPFTSVHRKQIIELAARFVLPAIYPYRYYVADGGLMSYGIDQIQQYRGAAIYLDRILNGARPGDLPVQAPTKYQLMINLKTAKALGLTISESFLLRADELIE